MRTCIGVIFFLTMMVNLFSTPYSKEDVLKIGINTFPISLNPVYCTSETSQAVINKVFDSLFYFDNKGRITGGLVENHYLKSNNKGTEILIELKKKSFFPGGKELEAEDVVQTVRLLQNRAFKYPYFSDIRFIKGIEKIDRYRLKMRLNGKVATWKNYLTFKILNSREIKNAVPETFRDRILSGTGPYRIKTVNDPSKIILELNRLYSHLPGDKSMYRFIEYIVISYTQLAPLKLINNEIDICELQPENVDAYRNIEKWQRQFRILKYKKFGYTYLVFNLRNSAITGNVRNLFYNLLINGDFPDRFLRGRGERVTTPFLLLNSKIKPVRFETTPLEKTIRFKILTNAESKLRKEFVLFLRSELKSSNILLEPVFLEYHSFLHYLKKGRYDMAISGFVLDIDYDMKDIFYSDAYFNYANFQCLEMDVILNRGLKEMDRQKREQIYMKAHNIWLKELPLIPLFNLYYYVGVSKKVAVPLQTYDLVGGAGDFLFNIRQWKMK